MKAIRLYDWHDSQKTQMLREVAVVRADDYTQNGKKRVFIWSKEDEFNYVLYPEDGTAYPEYENRLQQQRITARYLYEAVK